MKYAARFAIPLALFLLTPGSVLASWPVAPDQNLPVYVGTADDPGVSAVSDGANGAIVLWGTGLVIARHLLSDGTFDSNWAGAGTIVSFTHPGGIPAGEAVTSDGAGGAIIGIQDGNGFSTGDIYLVRLKVDGLNDAAWGNGVGVATSPTREQVISLASDGAGGAFVLWSKVFTAFTGSDDELHLSRVLANGTLAPGFGTTLDIVDASTTGASMRADGSGGVILAWHKLISAGIGQTRVQRVDGSGTRLWNSGIGYLALGTSEWGVTSPSLAVDGLGGTVVTWFEHHSSGPPSGTIAEHVRADGTADPAWATHHLVSSANAVPVALADGVGGTIVQWQVGNQMFVVRLQSDGSFDPRWPVVGVRISRLGLITRPAISDGQGGAYVPWQESNASASDDLYATHIAGDGSIDLTWDSPGTAISIAPGDQRAPVSVASGNGSQIFVWRDLRPSTGGVYAQRVDRFGFVGGAPLSNTVVRDLPNDEGAVVELRWGTSAEDRLGGFVTFYDLYRADPPGSATPVWTLMGTFPATAAADGYVTTAPTLVTSTLLNPASTRFQVVARNSDGSQKLTYPERSGDAIDNLAPANVTNLTGAYASGVTQLAWTASSASDLLGYNVYANSLPNAPLTPAARIAQGILTTSIPVSGSAGSYYRVTAVDIHDNESEGIEITPESIVGVTNPAAREFVLLPPSPQPSRESATLRWSMATPGAASLSILDLAGRTVRVLNASNSAAGPHESVWNLRDARGVRVTAGVYFARLSVAGGTRVQRVVIIE